MIINQSLLELSFKFKTLQEDSYTILIIFLKRKFDDHLGVFDILMNYFTNSAPTKLRSTSQGKLIMV